jgi:hypothetical protein
VEDIIQLIESLGGLRDATITGLLWQPVGQVLEIEIEDLCAGLAGHPDYPGPVAATFIFSGVTKFEMDVDLADTVVIEDWIFAGDGTPNSVLHVSPGRKIVIACGGIACRKAGIEA